MFYLEASKTGPEKERGAFPTRPGMQKRVFAHAFAPHARGQRTAWVPSNPNCGMCGPCDSRLGNVLGAHLSGTKSQIAIAAISNRKPQIADSVQDIAQFWPSNRSFESLL